MYKLYTDGGARGNPGPGAAGIVLKGSTDTIIKELGKYLGKCTNNEAEYRALILGLNVALAANALELSCYLDSELIVKQLNGQYKVKNANLRALYEQVKILEPQFTKISYHHIPRKENKEADKLVNQTLDALQ